MKRKTGLFDRSFWQVVLPLALPIALQNLLSNSFRLVDTLMIGRLGDVSIAAVGLAGYISFFVELIGFGLASGSAVFLAQYHGAGNRRGISRTFGALLTFTVPVGILFTVMTICIPERLMGLFTDDALLIAEGVRYLKYACYSYTALMLSTALGITLRCTENVRLPMYVSGMCALLNAVLNYTFIFGLFGLPAMGVAGAGLATAISSALSPLLIILISIKKRNVLIMPLNMLFDLKGFLKPFWSRALPVVLNELMWSLSIVLINMVFGRLGTDNYAAFTVVRTIENIVFVAFVGICNACNILVGKNIGAGKIEDAKMYAKRFLLLVPVFGVTLGILIALLRGAAVSLFDLSATAAHTARMLLLMYAVDVSIRNIPYLGVVGIFRAGGDTKTGLWCDVGVQYLLVVPVTVLCGLVWKVPFLWTYLAMLIVDDVAKLCIVVPHFVKMKWIRPIAADKSLQMLADSDMLSSYEPNA